MVRALKYHGQTAYARVLGEQLATYLRRVRRQPWPECIVPVPLADKRFHERGFNQAMEIGRTLQARLDIPMRADLVYRVRETREQAGLDRAERRKNVRKAFATSNRIDVRQMAILDDVVTTGSTADELARVLMRAGATQVELWAVARVSL